MIIFTTFNKKIYEFSGAALIKSINEKMPEAKIIAYKEFKEDIGVQSVDINKLKTLNKVIRDNIDIVHESFGGNAKKIENQPFWNTRWPGWFRKIVMAHHATCTKNYNDMLLFIDSDVRFKKEINENVLRDLMDGAAIGIIKGDREAIESGFIAVDGTNPLSKEFYNTFMDCFLFGQFKSYKRWDDGYVMTKIVEKLPSDWVHDFAEGKTAKKYTNSNGHTTNNQIVPFSEIAPYIEHDKGLHLKNNIK
jgi:hypothetical protein